LIRDKRRIQVHSFFLLFLLRFFKLGFLKLNASLAALNAARIFVSRSFFLCSTCVPLAMSKSTTLRSFTALSKPSHCTGFCFGRFLFPVFRCCPRLQMVGQITRYRTDILNRFVKYKLVRLGRFAVPAYLADELQGGCMDFFVSRRRHEIVKRSDISAHRVLQIRISRKHSAASLRMPQQGPYFAQLPGQLLPGLAAIATSEYLPEICATENQIRVRGMSRHHPWR